MKHSQAIHINLLQCEDERKRRLLVSLAMFLFLALMAGTMGYFISSAHQQVMALREQNSQLRSDLGRCRSEQARLKYERDMLKGIDERREIVKAIQKIKISGVQIMGEIEKSMPQGMVMIAVDIEKEKITANGYAPQHQDVAYFLSGLRRSSLFKDVMLASSKLDEDTNEVEFSVEMGWEAKTK
ncbi:MAG: PilN domain-containing protein [Syntrophomonas sp.]